MKKTTIAAALIAVIALSGCAKTQNTPIKPEANKETAQSSTVTTKTEQNTQTTTNQDSNNTTSNTSTQPAKPEQTTNSTQSSTKAPSTQPVKTTSAASNANAPTTTKAPEQTNTSNQGRIVTTQPQPINTGSHGGYGITTNEVAFTVISDVSILPEGYKQKINNLKTERGYFYSQDGDDFLMTISSGQRNSGGYDIKVISVEDIEGITKVIVEETTPPEGAMVTQALTYPTVTIKLPLIHERVQVVNVKGEKFDPITMVQQ